MLRIRFVVLSLLLLLCLPSCAKKARDFASYPIQNPQGIDFEGDPDFVSSYMRYIGTTEGRKNPQKGMSIFELDSVEALEEFEPVDAGWEVDKIPPGKMQFEEFLTNNLDALKTNVVDAVRQAKDSFGAVADVTKKALLEGRDNNARRRGIKRVGGTFRGAVQNRSGKLSKNQSVPWRAETATREGAENVTAPNEAQEKSMALEKASLGDKNTENGNGPTELSANEPFGVDDSKTKKSAAAALEQEQVGILKADAENSGSSSPSQSGSMSGQGRGMFEDGQHQGLTSQDGSTLNAKIENSSSIRSSRSEGVDNHKSEVTQKKQDENVAQKDDSLVYTSSGTTYNRVDEREEKDKNKIFSAEENISQQNSLVVDPCECSCCTEDSGIEEEVQESIPLTEESKTSQGTQSSAANYSGEKVATYTVKSTEILAQSLPFCKSECGSAVIYSTDPIMESVGGEQVEEKN